MIVSKTWQHCKRSSEQLNCTQFDHLILRKIVKIVATRCHILRLKCTNLISAGAPPQIPLGELTSLIPGVSFQTEGGKGKKGGGGINLPNGSQKLGSRGVATGVDIGVYTPQKNQPK